MPFGGKTLKVIYLPQFKSDYDVSYIKKLVSTPWSLLDSWMNFWGAVNRAFWRKIRSKYYVLVVLSPIMMYHTSKNSSWLLPYCCIVEWSFGGCKPCLLAENTLKVIYRCIIHSWCVLLSWTSLVFGEPNWFLFVLDYFSSIILFSIIFHLFFCLRFKKTNLRNRYAII